MTKLGYEIEPLFTTPPRSDKANVDWVLVQSMREALEPFAACAPIFDNASATRPSADDDAVMSWHDHRVEGERAVNVGDFRRARATLSALAQVKP